MKTINRLFALGAVSAFSISPCLAEADATTFSEYMELSEKALLNEDSHNAEIYEELAVMKREADSNPDYNWTAFNAKKAQLKDRKAKPFKKRAIEFFTGDSGGEQLACLVVKPVADHEQHGLGVGLGAVGTQGSRLAKIGCAAADIAQQEQQTTS